MVQRKTNTISGEAYWAHIIQPTFQFEPSGMWSVEICNLDAANREIAEADGLTIKNKGDERGDHITLSQRVQTNDGQYRKMVVEDAKCLPFPSDKRIGNGSKIKALYTASPYPAKGQREAGVKGWLKKVQVIDLFEYEPDTFDVVPGGYEAPQPDEIPFDN